MIKGFRVLECDTVQDVRDIPTVLQRQVEAILNLSGRVKPRYIFVPSSTNPDDGDVYLQPSVAAGADPCCGQTGRWVKEDLGSGGGGGVTLPINESDVTGLVTDLASLRGAVNEGDDAAVGIALSNDQKLSNEIKALVMATADDVFGRALSYAEWVKTEAEAYSDALFASGTGSSIRESKTASKFIGTGVYANQDFDVVTGTDVTFTVDETQDITFHVQGTIFRNGQPFSFIGAIGFRLAKSGGSTTDYKLQKWEFSHPDNGFSPTANTFSGHYVVKDVPAGTYTATMMWGNVDGNTVAWTLYAGNPDYPAGIIVKYSKVKVAAGGGGALSDDNPADVSTTTDGPGIGTEASRKDHVHKLNAADSQLIIAHQVFGG